jgi:hypothetical protein
MDTQSSLMGKFDFLTFTKVGPQEVVLRMEHPIAPGKYELILEVIFTRE